jgi:hypothetical protein
MDATEIILWVITIIGGSPFIGYGLYFAWGGFRLMLMGIGSLSWRATTGTVLSADVQPHVDRDLCEGGIWKHHFSYRPQITFEFLVAGSRYVGKRLRFGHDLNATRLLARYAEGQLADLRPGVSTPVYYNPRDPAAAVVHRGISKYSLQRALVGLLVTGFGLAFLLLPHQPRSLFESIQKSLEWVVFVPVVVTLAGPVLWLFARHLDRSARTLAEAPTVPGKVFWTGRIISRMNKSAGLMHKGEVAYHYEVDGVQYTGSRMTLADVTGSQRQADQVLEAYPVGAEVTVFCNPRDPADSTLTTQAGFGGLLIRVVAVFFALVGGVLTWVFHFATM